MPRKDAKFLAITSFLIILFLLFVPISGAVILVSQNRTQEYTTDDDSAIYLDDSDTSLQQQPNMESNPSQQASYNDHESNNKVLSQSVSFPAPEITIKDGYSYIDIASCLSTGAVSEPDLKTKVFSFKFKPGTEFNSIEFTPETEFIESLPHGKPLAPVQPPIPVSQLDAYSFPVPDPVLPDTEIYSSSEPFPELWFETNKRMGLDFELDKGVITLFLTVKLFPARYLPAQNELLYTTSGVISIDYTLPTDPAVKSAQTESQSNSGSESRSGSSSPPTINDRYSILIIGPELFRQNLTRLAEYKNSTGLPAKFVSITEIQGGKYFELEGDDDQEEIKYFIYNAKLSWNMTYVILGADTPLVPHRNAKIINEWNPGDELVPSDLYYADLFDSSMNFCDWDYNNNGIYGEYDRDSRSNLDKADLVADVLIGRLPASSNPELEIIVDKIINYESFTYGQTWFDNATLSGTNTFDTGVHGGEPPDDLPEGEYACEQIANNYLTDFTLTKIYDTTYYTRDLDSTGSNTVNTINKGAGFATFHDHGTETAWANTFYISHVKQLTNGDKLPFFNFDACLTGAFDRGSGDAIAEHVVLKENGGGIIAIGASRIGYGQYFQSHVNRYSGYYNVHLYKNYDDGEGTAGRIFNAAKNDYLNNIEIKNFADFKTVVEFTLFGDPSLSVGGIPLQDINITCEENTSAVAPGQSTNYFITVTNNGTLSKPIKLYISGVPLDWEATLNESIVIVPGKDKRVVKLTVKASEDSYFSEVANIEIYAYYSKNKDRTVSVITKTSVSQIQGLELFTTSSTDTVLPGEPASYWFRINNLGNNQESINLSANLTQPSDGWVFEFPNDEYNISIEPFGYKIIIINATSPLKTYFGSYNINVTAKIFNYFGLRSQDSVIFEINILRTQGLILESEAELLKTLNPGENCTFHLGIKNTGNYWDQYKFTLLMYPKTWDINLSQNDMFKVDAFSERSETLYVGIPAQTELGQYNIKLRVQSQSNHSVLEDISFIVKVNRTYGLELVLDEVNIATDPGEPVKFNLTITHLGNAEDDLDLEILNLPAKWYENLTNTLIMNPFGTYYSTIEIAPHLYSITGTYPFQLAVTVNSNQEIYYLDLNVTVNRINGYEFECNSDNFNIEAGQTQKFSFNIQNNGNGNDKISFMISEVPENWEINWTPADLNSDNEYIELGAFESTSNINVKIGTDPMAIAETNRIVVTSILNSTGEELEEELFLTIKPYYGVKIEVDAADTLIQTNPDEEIIITINITNEGNTVDNITRIINGLPSGWSVRYPEYTYELGPFETRREDIRITIPSNESDNEVDIRINVNSESSPEENDEEKSAIIVEEIPLDESEDRSNPWDLANFDKMFIYWILPIVLLIIVILIIVFLLIRQRREEKEEQRTRRELDEHEYDDYYDEAEQLYGSEYVRRGHGHGHPQARSGRTRRHPIDDYPPPPPGTKAKIRSKSKIGVSHTQKLKSSTSKTKRKRLDESYVDDYGYDYDIESRPPPRDITLEPCPTCGEMVGLDEFQCPYCGEIFETLDKDKSKITSSQIKGKGKADHDVHDDEYVDDDDTWDDVDENADVDVEELDEESIEFEIDEDEVETETEIDEDELEEMDDVEELDEIEEIEELDETDDEDEGDIDWEMEEE